MPVPRTGADPGQMVVLNEALSPLENTNIKSLSACILILPSRPDYSPEPLYRLHL